MENSLETSLNQVRYDKEDINLLLERFLHRRIMVIGDVMLDAYWWGKVERISPEAPVPIVSVRKRDYRLGGAANVALNLKKLGAQPIVCAVVGNDFEGDILKGLMNDEKIATSQLIAISNRPTTMKTRIIGNQNQLLRIDSEEEDYLQEEDYKVFLDTILSNLSNCELILFEDYDKGLISPKLIEEVVKAAKALSIPVIVDPKKNQFLDYKDVTIFKPNLRELSEGLKLDLNQNASIEEIVNAARTLIDQQKVKYALITLSERGILIVSEKEYHHIPAHLRNIYDVSGAGDTVVSVASLAYLANASLHQIAAIANLAGGIVCEKVGVVPISLEELKVQVFKEFC